MFQANKVAVFTGHSKSQSDSQGTSDHSGPAANGTEPRQDDRVDESLPQGAQPRTLSDKKLHFEREVDGDSCFRFWVRDPVAGTALGHSADFSMLTVYQQTATDEQVSRRENLPDGGRGFWSCLRAGLRALCKEKLGGGTSVDGSNSAAQTEAQTEPAAQTEAQAEPAP